MFVRKGMIFFENRCIIMREFCIKTDLTIWDIPLSDVPFLFDGNMI